MCVRQTWAEVAKIHHSVTLKGLSIRVVYRVSTVFQILCSENSGRVRCTPELSLIEREDRWPNDRFNKVIGKVQLWTNPRIQGTIFLFWERYTSDRVATVLRLIYSHRLLNGAMRQDSLGSPFWKWRRYWGSKHETTSPRSLNWQ